MKDTILNFLADNYLIFMIVAVILLFALIGFIVDGKKKKQKDVEAVPKVSVPPQPTPAVANPNVAPQAETITPAPTMASASEPSLSGLEATANDVTINTSVPVTPVTPVPEQPNVTPAQSEVVPESIFNTPAVETSAPVMTTPGQEPVQQAQPTLVIEEPTINVAPQEPTTAMPATPTPEVAPAPMVGEMPFVSETPQTPVAPTPVETPVLGETPTIGETPSVPATPTIGETPSVPATPTTEIPQSPGTPLQ